MLKEAARARRDFRPRKSQCRLDLLREATKAFQKAFEHLAPLLCVEFSQRQVMGG